MKKILFINTISILIVLSIWSVTTQIVYANEYSPNHNNLYTILGFLKAVDKVEAVAVAQTDESEHTLDSSIGDVAQDFDVVLNDVSFEGFEVLQEYEKLYGKVDETSIVVDDDMIYHNSFLELPLYYQDYYWRKYENAVAGVIQLNAMPILQPGDRVSVIGDKYIKILVSEGYLRPGGKYGFASGVCWSTTAMGIMMDEANKDFNEEYGISLFVFNKYDRAPHSNYYRTYMGRGYTILQKGIGVAVQDYKFTLNPDIATHPELEGFKAKIVMVATTEHDTGAYGQSVGSFVISNYEF